MPQATETTLEINLNALTHNYNFLRSKIKASTKMLAVVKAYGYGGDACRVAKHLETLSVDYFAVAYAQEGVALRDAGITTPILVLHPLPDNFDIIVERCLEPSMYSHKMLSSFIEYAKSKNQTNYPVHLKFNTGLNRLGFQASEVTQVVEKIKEHPSLKIKSVLSHLAASEDVSEKAFTLQQLAQFQDIKEKVTSLLSYTPWFHTLNTSGIINFPQAQYDMVRSGIGLYGFGNAPEVDAQLEPVFSLKTVISQLHTLSAGDTVGYNRAQKIEKPTTIATLPIGHADGINRAFGNGVGWVTIRGKKAPITGNVCMDMIMVDVTGIDCNEGDEVVLFGKNPTAHTLSKSVGSISYELLTAISQRVKRIVT